MVTLETWPPKLAPRGIFTLFPPPPTLINRQTPVCCVFGAPLGPLPPLHPPCPVLPGSSRKPKWCFSLRFLFSLVHPFCCQPGLPLKHGQYHFTPMCKTLPEPQDGIQRPPGDTQDFHNGPVTLLQPHLPLLPRPTSELRLRGTGWDDPRALARSSTGQPSPLWSV